MTELLVRLRSHDKEEYLLHFRPDFSGILESMEVCVVTAEGTELPLMKVPFELHGKRYHTICRHINPDYPNSDDVDVVEW